MNATLERTVKVSENSVPTKDHYKTLIVGSSGKGKTYSFRGMDPNTTGFINVENKPLPFKNNFKYHARPKNSQEVLQTMKEYAQNPDIKSIVIDSLSAVFDLILEESRASFRGFDVWDNYNRRLTEFFKIMKLIKKEMFLTAHYEILNIEGAPEKRVKTKGKEFEGQIEAQFTTVVYSDSKFKDNKHEYFFKLAGEGISAKFPPDIFPGKDTVDNDAALVLAAINKFVNNN